MKKTEFLEPKHIILAEDDVHSRTSLSLIFRKAGYKVTAATDGKTTLDFLLMADREGTTVDLLVTDLQMPGLTGIQLIAELKKNNIHIPTVVISGFITNGIKNQLMQMGYDDLMEKPLEPNKILKKVESLLNKEQLPLEQ